MRKFYFISLVLLLVFSESCRKAADDPWISFRSRKERVAGKWKVTSGYLEQNDNTTNNATVLYKFTFSENFAQLYFSGSSATHYGFTSDNVKFNEQFEFKKNGDFTHYMYLDGDTWTEKGMWNFTSGVGERYNKSELLLMYNESVTNYYGKRTWDGEVNSYVFDLLELRNDKIVIKTQWKYYDQTALEFFYYTEYKILEPQ